MKDNQSGMALLVVVLLSAMLAVLAAAFYFANVSQITAARRNIRIEKAFFIAEAGVERAKAELRQLTNALDDVLLGADGTPHTPDDGVLSSGFSTPFGGGCFSVRITDNTDSDASLFADADKSVVIWSTGVYQNVSRVLEVCVNVGDHFNLPTSTDGSVSVCGSDAEIVLAGSSLIDGHDHALPASFFCGGAGCLGSVIATNPASAGVHLASTSSVVTVSGSAQILGDPPISLASNSPSLSEAYWTNLVETLIPFATISLPGGVLSGNQTIGTRDHPQIAVISGNTKITGNIDGAGILFITGAVEVDFVGTFHYEGLIIMVGDNSSLDDKGAASLFGSVVMVGAGTDIKPHGSPQIMYSTQALGNLSNLTLPPPEISVVYWREVK